MPDDLFDVEQRLIRRLEEKKPKMKRSFLESLVGLTRAQAIHTTQKNGLYPVDAMCMSITYRSPSKTVLLLYGPDDCVIRAIAADPTEVVEDTDNSKVLKIANENISNHLTIPPTKTKPKPVKPPDTESDERLVVL